MEELIKNLERVRVDMEKYYYDMDNWSDGMMGTFCVVYANVKDLIQLELDGECDIEYICTSEPINDPNLVLLLEFETIELMSKDEEQSIYYEMIDELGDNEYTDMEHTEKIKELNLNFIKQKRPFDDIYKWTAEDLFFYLNEKLQNDEIYNYFLEKIQLKTV